ncbi:hypothetical protein C10C_0523 [Chlamydia serpentis]|uniref:Uncharacterized protein n=1 Tax=Chlamydia serpentis TaxID=1967782 RepID=A0A2R8FB81_9CHLA|nr:phage holin family protein [Chlamydia serpentis]SPN73684.1 hypothetical protein C10C_0523 [Chlamydia serpentis]
MKFPRISISDLLPTQMLIWWRGGEKVHYLPNAQNLSKKIVGGVLACLGLGLLGCAAFAAGACLTIFPCIGLVVIGFIILGIAYLQYSKGWSRVQLPRFRKTDVFEKPLTWVQLLSLLQSWNKIRAGCYYHPGCPQVQICEASQEIIKKISRKKFDKNTSVFLIQEFDGTALKKEVEEKNTLLQKTFGLDPSTIASCPSKNQKKISERLSPEVIPRHSTNETCLSSAIYIKFPKVGEDNQCREYIRAYSQAFFSALNQIRDLSGGRKQNIYILTPILGTPLTPSLGTEDEIKLISKAAFLYAAQLVAKYLAKYEPNSVRITFILKDLTSQTPLSSPLSNLSPASLRDFVKEHNCMFA